MRQEQQSITAAPRAADFKFHFQMTNEGARHACSVMIRATSEANAATIFRENWSVIEWLARRRLAAKDEKPLQFDPGELQG